jgi:16S rRNA processing protein RimM
LTLVTAGRVGRAHGHDGSFWVEEPAHALSLGTEVTLRGATHEVVRRGGTDARPLIRLEGLEDPRTVRGERLLVADELGDDEWLASDLAACEVEGLGPVRRVVAGPSCSVLELEDGTLVPLISDAIRSIDLERRLIVVDRDFLGRS